MLVGVTVAVACAAGLAVARGVAPARGVIALKLRVAMDPSTAGAPVLISGRVLGRVQRARVVLWQRLARQRRFVPVAATATEVGGGYRIMQAPRTNRAWSVAVRGLRSRTIEERVRARATLSATPTGAGVRLAGVVSPGHGGERILLEQHADSRWLVFARPRLNRASSFSLVQSLPSQTEVRAVFAGDRRNVRSYSPVMTIPQPVGATLGTAKALPAHFFGLNWDYSGAALFSGNVQGEYGALAALQPGTLRWPGGTDANYFQWQLGYPTDVGMQNGFADTLGDLEAAYTASGAPPIFDLNVMSSTLESQVQMLQTAQSLGLPIAYLELGNELYLDYHDYANAFPTAADYGQTVAEWVKALHRDFPGALVAAAASGGSADLREQTWNTEMLTAARLGGGLPDAITLHVKPGWDAGVSVAELPTLFTGPYQSVSQAKAVLAALPDPEPAWMTEYNLAPDASSNPAQGLYAHALVVAEYALLIQRISDATLTDYWTSLSGSENSAYVPSASGALTLTPAGLVLEWIEDAATGAAAAAPISFAGGPALSHGGPAALVGAQFAPGRDVLVNLSSRWVVAPSGGAIPAGLPYKQVSGDPTRVVPYAAALAAVTGTVGETLTLPPYSITLVGAPDASSPGPT